jgi:hypothetical protein
MTPEDLQQFMDNKNLTQSDIAWITGKNVRTVQFWLTGKHPVPQLVAMLCQAIEENQIDFDWIVQTIRNMEDE